MYNLKSFTKLNLFLHLIGRNEKNYHLIESLMVFLDLHDEIKIEPSNELEVNFSFNPEFPEINCTNNTLTKVIEKFGKIIDRNINLKISVCKNIPVGAGLGGGSSNAATLIKFLQEYYEYKLSEEDEIELALSIGCDTVACLNTSPIFVEGIGETVTKCEIDDELKNSHILLIYPQIISLSIEGYKIFKNQNMEFTKKIEIPKIFSFDFIKQQHNDLTLPTQMQFKEIELLNEYMKKYNQEDDIIARMSGSGSAFFILSSDIYKTEKIKDELYEKFPKYFYVKTKFIN